MTVIGLKNHVTIIPPLLKTTGRDSWISVLFAMMTVFPWLFLLIYIQNKSNQKPIKDWLKQRIGKVGSAIVLFIIAFYLLFLAASTMRETLGWIKTTFLPETPILLMLIIYTVLCILLATTNIQTVVIVNTFVLFGVVIFGFFVAFTNIQVKDYGLVRPFLEHGFQPVLHGMVYPASGFVEIIVLLFLQDKIKTRIRWFHLVIILFIMTGLTMGPLLGAIVEFGPHEAAKQRYPAYEEWGLVTIGRFIEHVDFLSIYQWLTGAFIRTGLFLYIIVDLFQMRGNSKRIWKIIAPLFLASSLLLFMIEDNKFISLERDYLLPATFFFFFILAFIFSTIAAFSGKTKKKTQA